MSWRKLGEFCAVNLTSGSAEGAEDILRKPQNLRRRIILASGGNVWCGIDDRVLLFVWNLAGAGAYG